MNCTRPAADTEILMGTVEAFYGSRLSPDEIQLVRKGVQGIIDALETLRIVRLTHEDAPFSIAVPVNLEGGHQ